MSVYVCSYMVGLRNSQNGAMPECRPRVGVYGSIRVEILCKVSGVGVSYKVMLQSSVILPLGGSRITLVT